MWIWSGGMKAEELWGQFLRLPQESHVALTLPELRVPQHRLCTTLPLCSDTAEAFQRLCFTMCLHHLCLEWFLSSPGMLGVWIPPEIKITVDGGTFLRAFTSPLLIAEVWEQHRLTVVWVDSPPMESCVWSMEEDNGHLLMFSKGITPQKTYGDLPGVAAGGQAGCLKVSKSTLGASIKVAEHLSHFHRITE